MPESPVRRAVTIVNKLGLHARAAAKFVTMASRYQADVRLYRQQREANGKSIMGVMMLAAAKGTEVEIVATGEDAPAAVSSLASLVEERFGESE